MADRVELSRHILSNSKAGADAAGSPRERQPSAVLASRGGSGRACNRAWILDTTPVALIDYLEARERLIEFARRIMRSWPPDSVLVTPTLTRLPAPVGGIQSRGGITDDAVRFSALVRVWNVTGQPAISLPLHDTADGIPVGVQLIAPPGREDLLLGLAAQLEQNVGWHPQL